MTIVRTVARAALAAIFVSSGTDAVLNPERLVPKAKPVTDRIAPLFERSELRLPTETRTLVQVNGAVQATAGLLMLTPLRRPAAVVLAASLIPTTLAGHPFWQAADSAERAVQRTGFLKNLGLFGGLIFAALDTGGKPGVRWRAGHYADHANRSVRRTARTTRSKASIAMKSAALGRHLPDWRIKGS
jgi:putative oxidoreductase